MVIGCPNLALERHEGPTGAVWLCGKCGATARRNLADEAAKEAILEALAAPFERDSARRAGRARL
jgi:coenzyme F420-reducing hydrogenase gamma subunit